ncbi:lyase family protein [Trueperella abortisuis]|uniref:lyase family protein n=1 Tax=Trueperella abortisuis TaxID=445930 RepID=UPI0028936FC3|nr:lyase family protein [Trueperella abortisuis]
MAISLVDSVLTSANYTTKEMRDLWGEKATLQSWFDVEVALAEVQARLGAIPAEAATAIKAAATITDERVAQIGKDGAGHPLVLALDNLRAHTSDAGKPWVHFGATTQDILDTGRVLQIRQGLDLIDDALEKADAAISAFTIEHADTLMAQRTNGQLAVPGTLGLRGARWLSELRRGRERLSQERERVLCVQFSGAAGTYASFGDAEDSFAVGLAEQLQLRFDPVSWHSSRDSYSALIAMLAVLARSANKVGDDLFEMQRTDLSEASEVLDMHTSGSTTMPQKRNPFATMAIAANARLAVASAVALLVQPPDLLERDPRQFEVERDVFPRVFTYTHKALMDIVDLLPRIQIDKERLAENARQEGPLIVTEGIMMKLAPALGHEAAHDLLQDFAKEYRSSGISLADFVKRIPDVNKQLKDVDLHNLARPDWYTGISARIALETARK